MWFPPTYRATRRAILYETIALGHSSGRISIPRFKEGDEVNIGEVEVDFDITVRIELSLWDQEAGATSFPYL